MVPCAHHLDVFEKTMMFEGNKKILRCVSYGLLLLGCSSILVSCGDPIGGAGTSPVFVTARAKDGEGGGFSDVYNPSGYPTMDKAWVTFDSRYRDPSDVTTTDFADVMFDSMVVTYFRYDSNPNVPEPFQYAINNTLLPEGGTLDMEIPIVLAKAKAKSPLKELAFGGGEGIIYMQAKIDFYGKDVAGNKIHCDVTFNIEASDFPND
jgi:hypothetical protein